ncbi:MAG: ABC transporter ATP-binding protein [Devosia sp.]
MSSAVVEARGVGLVLPGAEGHPLTILNDVSFTLGAGEVGAVVGPSGSGKTSLLMILAGLERPTSGTVRIAGTDLAGMDEDKLAIFRRRKLGILFQNFHLVPSMTALENVALTLEIADPTRSWKSVETEALAALDAVGLSARAGHRPSALSGGEQQRVGLARAMVANPPLLLADEPTGNLDQETGAKVVSLMFDLARRNGTAILLVTHDPALAAKADRRFAMSLGVLAEDIPA